MRRTPLALLALVALAACGSSDDDDDAASTTPDTEAADSTVADTSATTVPEMSLVTTVPVSLPEVSLPTELPTQLVITTLTEGSGQEAAEGDTVYVNYLGVRSEDGTEFDNNFGGNPFPVTLGQGGVIQGWEEGLVGATTGQRLQLDIPSDLAYGDQPQGEVIQPGDALTFVIDVLAVVPPVDPGDAPTDIPTSSELVTEPTFVDQRAGTGPAIEAGGRGLFQLVIARGDDGEVLQSTWTTGQPQAVVIPEEATEDGATELIGMQVGSRRAITIPPNPAAGLEPETNLVVIADLVAIL